MQTIKDFALRATVKVDNLLHGEKGQGALEYIAIVGGLIVLVAAGFLIAGGQVKCEAGNFVLKALGKTTTAC